MVRLMNKIVATIFFIFGLCVSGFPQETLTITTYYPSPFGSYDKLQAWSFGVGDNNGSGGLDAGDVPNTHGDVWIDGSVGIGTTTPQNPLDVEGSAVIGAAYSGTEVGPINGLLVEGNVGIGTTSPTAKLEVNGNIKAGGGASGQATCWKGTQIGYCSSAVAADGSCSCI